MKRILRNRPVRSRKGAAVVEFAILSPILVMLIMGGIDLGQFINTGQVVSNASRVGVRKASRFETKSTASVQNEVIDYISQHVPGLDRTTIASATTVTVKAQTVDINGTVLGAVPSGQRLDVEVSFDYGSVRWIPGLPVLSGKTLTTTSCMRRD